MRESCAAISGSVATASSHRRRAWAGVEEAADQIAVGRLAVDRDRDRDGSRPASGHPVERARLSASFSGVIRFREPAVAHSITVSTFFAKPPRSTGGCGFCAAWGTIHRREIIVLA